MHIAPHLAKAYVDRIRASGLENLARARDPKKSPVGGPTVRAADEHFAQAFDGSVARAALAFLDPKSEVSHVADALTMACAGGKLAILDVPSGAGAFSLAILCSLAELRAAGVFPRQPLDVIVVGGEFNRHASTHAEALFRCVDGFLSTQAIHVAFKALPWDVCDKVSTAQVLRRYVADADTAERKLVVISNFSGFLTKESKQNAASAQLDEIFRYCAGKRSTLLWIEPQSNAATKTLFGWVASFVKTKAKWLAQLVAMNQEDQALGRTESAFAPALRAEGTSMVRLAVMRFDLGTSDSE